MTSGRGGGGRYGNDVQHWCALSRRGEGGEEAASPDLNNSVCSKLESRQFLMCDEWHSAERARRCFSGRDADRRRLLRRRRRSRSHLKSESFTCS